VYYNNLETSEEVLSMISEAKNDEADALSYFVQASKKGKGLFKDYTVNNDLDLDMIGIDGWLIAKNNKKISAQVKTYKFKEDYAIKKGWWDEGQVACVEITGGPKSSCFLKNFQSDLTIFYYPGVKSKKYHTIYPFESEVIIDFASKWKSNCYAPGRLCKNIRSRGSFVTVTLEKLEEYRINYFRSKNHLQ